MEESEALAIVAGIARFGHIAAAMLLFGASLFPFYTGIHSWPPRWARFVPLTLASILLSTIVLAASLTLVDLTGETASLASRDELRGFFLETDFGPVWLARIAFSTAAFAVALGFAIPSILPELRHRQQDALLLILSAGILISLAAGGHARAALAGGSRDFAVSSEAIHLLAAGAWTGGLPPLLFHLVMVARQEQETSLALPMLQRFSFVGQWTVVLLLAGGLSTLAALIAAWNIKVSGLQLSGYSVALFVKLALLAIMRAIAVINRFILMPQLERRRTGVSLLRRMVLIECVLGALIIAAATVLGSQAPPFTETS
jgi:putative copper resistance protein D